MVNWEQVINGTAEAIDEMDLPDLPSESGSLTTIAVRDGTDELAIRLMRPNITDERFREAVAEVTTNQAIIFIDRFGRYPTACEIAGSRFRLDNDML